MELSKKWWFWLIILFIALIIMLSFLPIWCTTYYLPGANETVIEKTHCGPIYDVFQVY